MNDAAASSAGAQSEHYVHITLTNEGATIRGDLRFDACVDDADDGTVTGWNWDGRTLEVTGCRFGTYPLYYWADTRGICVSPSFERLLSAGAPPALDRESAAVFLRFGSCLGDDTLVASIKRMPPGGRLEWRIDGTWRVSGALVPVRPQRLAWKAAIEGFIDTFRAGVRRMRPTGDRVVVPLTGGRDSRHTLLELCAAGRRPNAVVTVRPYPPGGPGDANAASRMAEALGLTHIVLDPPESRVDAEVEKNRRSGFSTDWHAWALTLVDYISQQQMTDLYVGYGGDTLTRRRAADQSRLVAWQSGDLDAVATYLLTRKRSRNLALDTLVRANRRLDLLETTRIRLTSELGRHLDQPNPDLSFTFYNGLRRRTAPMWFPMCSDHTRIHLPYLDRDVFALLASLPLDMAIGVDFHTEAIAIAFPKYADVAYKAERWQRLNPPSYFRQYAAELIERVLQSNGSEVIDVAALVERLSGCARSGDGRLVEWLEPARALCVLQLESRLSGVREPS